MSDKVSFSIVTVCKDNLTGLISTYDSIAKQDYDCFELIIVDGKSTDGTLEWLISISDLRIKWISEIDNGVYDAMNKGVQLCTSHILTFLNAGDCFSDSSVLSRVADSFLLNDWKWAYGAMRLVSKEGDFIQVLSQTPFRARFLDLGLRYVPHQATFYKLDFFNIIGKFTESFSIAADQEFAIRAKEVSAPFSTGDIWVNFQAGGLHSQINYWEREMIYHRIRKMNKLLLVNSFVLDYFFSLIVGTIREFRERAGSFIKRDGYRSK